jgi:hypothetical protein
MSFSSVNCSIVSKFRRGNKCKWSK